MFYIFMLLLPLHQHNSGITIPKITTKKDIFNDENIHGVIMVLTGSVEIKN